VLGETRRIRPALGLRALVLRRGARIVVHPGRQGRRDLVGMRRTEASIECA
jgi:hypothetical protein